MTTVLVIGSVQDACVRGVLTELERRGADAVLIPGTEIRTGLGLNCHFSGDELSGYLFVGARRLPLEELAGVLFRPGCAFGAFGTNLDEEQQYVQTELTAAFYGLFEGLHCPIVNRAGPGVLCGQPFNESALAAALRDGGFTPASVLLASSSEQALEFYERHGRQALFGLPLAPSPRLLSGEEGARTLAQQSSGPCYLQAVPPGRWQRVLVAGGIPFAAATGPEELGQIPTPSSPVATPAAYQYHCGRLAERVGLELFEMLVVRGDDGRDVCFSLNGYPLLESWAAPVCERVTAILSDRFACNVKRAAA
jgi:hypothetical protein